MSDLKCGITVNDADHLANNIDLLLTNKEKRDSMISNGTNYVQSKTEVIEKISKEILSIQKRITQNVETDATA